MLPAQLAERARVSCCGCSWTRRSSWAWQPLMTKVAPWWRRRTCGVLTKPPRLLRRMKRFSTRRRCPRFTLDPNPSLVRPRSRGSPTLTSALWAQLWAAPFWGWRRRGAREATQPKLREGAMPRSRTSLHARWAS